MVKCKLIRQLGYFRNPSFLRRREGGFTFEVQQLVLECLMRGMEVEAFSGGIFVGMSEGLDAGRTDIVEVSFSGEEAS
jgi:hypothetical protein